MLVKFGLGQPPRNHTCEILDGTSEAIRTEKIGRGFFFLNFKFGIGKSVAKLRLY